MHRQVLDLKWNTTTSVSQHRDAAGTSIDNGCYMTREASSGVIKGGNRHVSWYTFILHGCGCWNCKSLLCPGGLPMQWWQVWTLAPPLMGMRYTLPSPHHLCYGQGAQVIRLRWNQQWIQALGWCMFLLLQQPCCGQVDPRLHDHNEIQKQRCVPSSVHL